MRILVPAGDDQTTLAWSYIRAFKALGLEVTLYDPMPRLDAQWAWRSRLVKRVLEKQLLRVAEPNILADIIALGRFDAIFIAKGSWSLSSLWTSYKKACPTTCLICYNADDPVTTWSRGANRPWVTEAVPVYDIYITYNKSLIGPISELGAKKILHLPFAWDPDAHPAMPFTDQADVVFVGNADTYRETWLTALVEHPMAQSWRIAIHGAWPDAKSERLRRAIHPLQVTGADMAKLTASSRIALNILREQNEGSHNMRTYEVPGVGGVLASQFSNEQHSVFPNGEAAIYFTSPEDMAPSLAPFLQDEDKLRALRNVAQAKVKSETYLDRAQVLVDAMTGVCSDLRQGN